MFDEGDWAVFTVDGRTAGLYESVQDGNRAME
jgi:hypothetical protein